MSARLEVATRVLRLEEGDAGQRALAAYWEARRQGRDMPTRRDLDVLDLRPWLGRLNLVEALGEDDLRLRLRGTSLTVRSGHLADGMRLSEIEPRPLALQGIRDHRATLASAQPARHLIELDIAGTRFSYERLTLPLAAGGGLPPMALILVQFPPEESRRFWERFLNAPAVPR